MWYFPSILRFFQCDIFHLSSHFFSMWYFSSVLWFSSVIFSTYPHIFQCNISIYSQILWYFLPILWFFNVIFSRRLFFSIYAPQNTDSLWCCHLDQRWCALLNHDMNPRDAHIRKSSPWQPAQQTHSICITCIQRRPNVFHVGHHCINVLQMFCFYWVSHGNQVIGGRSSTSPCLWCIRAIWRVIFINVNVRTKSDTLPSINPYGAGIDFRRQNLTSVDVKFWRPKSIPAL